MNNQALIALLSDARLRYLMAGGFNTLFAYALNLGMYAWLHERLPLVVITGGCAVLSISVAFLVYKLFVFATRGNWLREYVRCYLVYGGGAVVSIALLSVMVDGWGMSFWLAQAITTVGIVLLSFVMHRRFTFRSH